MLFPSSGGLIVSADAAWLLALLLVQSPQGCRTTLPPRGSSALCTADLPALAECPEASRLQSLRSLLSPTADPFHGPRQDISRSRMYAHDEVLCASCPRHELTFRVLPLPRPFVSTKVGLARAGFVAAATAAPTVCVRDCGKSVKALLLSLLLLHLLQRLM